MKRIIALLCAAAFIGTLAACAGNDTAGGTPASTGGTVAPVTADKTLLPSEYSDADFHASGDVAIETEYEVYGSDAPWVSYTVTNHTSEELMYGVPFSVEVNQNGQWYQVPFPGDSVVWIAIGILLQPNGTNAHSFSFAQLDYAFPDGQYRLIKEIGGERYYGVFNINKSSPITAETPFRYQALEKLPTDYTYEAALDNGDVVTAHDATQNIEKLEDFVNKASFGMAAMVRLVQYTIEGDPILTDIIYNQNCGGYYLCRQDNSRDRFGGTNTGITETIYSYLITDGESLYLSNCAGWEFLSAYPDAALMMIAPSGRPRDVVPLIGLVQEMTEKRIDANVTRYKVFSPGGDKSVSLLSDLGSASISENLSYGYEEPGRGETRTVADPEGIATKITGAFWLDGDSYVLVCDTAGVGKYFHVVGTSVAKSGYGSEWKVDSGSLEITG